MRSSDAIPSFDWGDIVVNLSVVRLTYCPLGPKTKTAKGGHMIHKKKIYHKFSNRGDTQINSMTLVAISNVHTYIKHHAIFCRSYMYIELMLFEL